MLKKTLAQGLGISPSMVSRLAKQGMPTHSLEAAQAWRHENLSPARTVNMRADMPDPPKQHAAVKTAEQAMTVARGVLDLGGDFAAIEPVARAALRAVPEHLRHLVGLDLEVMKVLCAPLLAACRECESSESSEPRGAQHNDADDEEPGRTLYRFAAGEIVINWEQVNRSRGASLAPLR